MDGTGSESNPSGYLLDPYYGQVYEISVQYLGFGDIEFRAEAVGDGNNATWITVHTIKYPGTALVPSLTQPSFPFLAAASSAGSTTSVAVYASSFAGFVEGDMVNTGPRMSYYNNSGVTSSTSAYTPLFTVRNLLVFQSRANQCVTKLLDVTGACKSTTGLTTFYLIRNATLTGTPNFQEFATNSCTCWDTAATGCSFTSNSQVIWSGTVSESGQIDHEFADTEITLQPNETLTLAVRSVTSTATCVGSINMREDQ
jgi:hypothetical protein